MFSIILPTYNRAAIIQDSIKSVIEQTYQYWELIVVDDGSTDNTEDCIKNLMLKENRIKYIYQHNQERSQARNNGIKIAKYKWICFLDSDDIFLSNHLQTFYENIQNYPRINFFYSLKEREEHIDFHNKHETILINSIHSQQVCLRKKILLENTFNKKLNIGEDVELWMRIACKEDLLCTNTETVKIISHQGRSINGPGIKNTLNHFKLVKRLMSEYSNFISISTKRVLNSNLYFIIAKKQMQLENRFSAIFNLTISLVYNITNSQSKHKILLILSLLCLYKQSLLIPYKK